MYFFLSISIIFIYKYLTPSAFKEYTWKKLTSEINLENSIQKNLNAKLCTMVGRGGWGGGGG